MKTGKDAISWLLKAGLIEDYDIDHDTDELLEEWAQEAQDVYEENLDWCPLADEVSPEQVNDAAWECFRD